jgi:outer membrane protein assembly factor BamB
MTSRFPLAFLLLGLAVVPGTGGDWPEFRGPDGQGHGKESGLPVVWGPARNVTWKVPVPGKGWSSPIVWKGRVYLTTAVSAPDGPPDALSLRALCLDSATGKTIWDQEVFREVPGSPRPHRKNSHASPTPLTDGQRLYVHFGYQGTACLDLEGKVVWENRELRFTPVHGSGGSPVLFDDLVIFSGDGSEQRFVAALEKATGKVRWKTDRPGDPPRKFSFSTPLVIDFEGRKQLISSASDMVLAYNPATGKELWKVRYDGYSVIPRPVFGHGLVFVCTGFNVPTLLAIRPDGTGDVTDTHIAWSMKRGTPHTPSPLLVGDDLYMISDTGTATCLDAKTGEVHWQERIGGNFSASPLYDDGKIYLQSEDGVGTVLAAGKTFKRLGRNSLGERSLASPAAAEGALFIRTEKHLYRIAAKEPVQP